MCLMLVLKMTIFLVHDYEQYLKMDEEILRSMMPMSFGKAKKSKSSGRDQSQGDTNVGKQQQQHSKVQEVNQEEEESKSFNIASSSRLDQVAPVESCHLQMAS